MACLDVLDRGVSLFTPNYVPYHLIDFRVRIGVGNRILFNQNNFISYGYSTWLTEQLHHIF